MTTMEYQWDDTALPLTNGGVNGAVPLLTALGCWQQIPVGFFKDVFSIVKCGRQEKPVLNRGASEI